MIVSLIGRDKICKVRLPEIVEGNYWLNYNQEKLININAKDDRWQIVCDDNININNNVTNRIVLDEYDVYSVYVKKLNDYFLLYCSLSCENEWNQLEVIGKSSITIGNKEDNDIIYRSNLVSNIHTKLLYYNGKWMIENFDSRFGTFINERPVLRTSDTLKNGDVVFIMGLKIVVMGKYIFINNPQNKVFFDNKILSRVEPNIKTNENSEYMKSDYEKNYFFRAPRLSNRIQNEIFKINLPPQTQKQEELPLMLTLGSSLSMGVIMIISVVRAIDGKISGTSSTKEMIFSLITAIVMMISMLCFPILIQKYNKKRLEEKEKKRKTKYREYLKTKRKQLENIAERQRKILFENYASEEECTRIVLEEGPRLWERNLNDYDFLNVRIGIGDVPLDVNIQLPEKEFTLNEDELIDECYNMIEDFKIIKSVPVVISLTQDNILGVINNTSQKVNRFLHSLIIQLITFHSYEDLKLVFLMDEDNIKSWELVKMLPHIWDNGKQMRFFTGNDYDRKKISQYLCQELNKRLDAEKDDYKSHSPYYLIITDNYKKIENLKIIKEILKMETNVGFSLLCLTNDLMQLPNKCETFISLENDKVGVIFQKENPLASQRKIIFDDSVIVFFDKIARVISNIPIEYTNKKGSNGLPDNYTFLDMYDVGTIEELNIYDRWKKHDSTRSLKAPIGIDESGGEIVLDIHEKFHGPHGLIAGSTGSGKSEFIMTYILSLAINYHPDDVTFVLIDYKGGGLAGAFQKRDIKLPHLVGTITNIDTNGLQRSLMSIQSELRRRQIMFNEARNMTEEGTIDIYKYQKLYHEGIVKTPISHLLIICDEFAELKQQQPDFMDELMSVSRIGRSLGVHLILATQKPSGIVNDQIRSNSKFSICLKVQDNSDSTDVIKRPDAANLKKAGQFYMQVGNNEYFVLGQSGWSGAPYIPQSAKKKNVDDSIEVISDIGETIKKTNSSINKNETIQGEQLTNILKVLNNIAKKNNIEKENLWLDNIDENIYLGDVREKYKLNEEENIINPVIGEYDDPFNQKQGFVRLDFSQQGNAIIYGNAESGKETLLSTMIYDLITTYSSDEVQIYILDFGTESLKIYKDAPHVGDVVTINEVEKIIKFFGIIQQEIKDRKKELIEYNGDYKLYLKESGKTMPMKVVIMNAFESFAEMSQNKFDDVIISLTREGIKCGIVFVLTVSNSNDIRYRLLQNFRQKIALQLNDNSYESIFEKSKIRPSHIFGRGLVDIGENQICEFQTAKICDARQYNVLIKETIQKLKENNLTIASKIPVVPDIVKIEDVKEVLKDLSMVPLGITKKDVKIYTYDFKNNFVTRIISNNIDEVIQFSMHLIQMLSYLNNINLCVINAEEASSDKLKALKKEFNKFIESLEHRANNICIIIGIDKFVNDYKTEENFEDKLKQAENMENCSLVFVDSLSKFNNQEYEDWYKQYISKENGIWIGNGFDSQYALSATNDRREIVGRCGMTFGYVVKKGKASMIKLIEMKEKDEDEE